jgi:hypothetical protein
MTITRAVFLLSALGVLAASSKSQTFVGIDFEQLASPNGCIRNATVPPTSTPAIPALKLPGAVISGGQVLSYANIFQTTNNVYYTFNGCAGVQPTITITFDGPASNVNMVVGDIWNFSENLQVTDDKGDNFTMALSSSSIAGQTLFIPSSNVRQITLTLPSAVWTAGSPAGFYIDNIDCTIDTAMNFVDPVPDLISGTGVVSDPESLATMGTLVRAIAADGTARVVLTTQTQHVGDMVTFSVINDKGNRSNSTREDGGISGVQDSQGSQQSSIHVAAVDSSQGPMAFAVYYPPADFSRGSQDDQLGSRDIQIEVDPQGPPSPEKRALTILRPPVVLVHDLWEDPTSWDDFAPLVNDTRYFIRRAAYNGVLGGRITASIPAFPNSNLAHARESALGIGYSAPLLLSQIAQYVNEFRTVENAAASQADVVVHGMGGVIARASVQLPDYAAPESYGQGSIDKLITVGTPHLGTPLATALLRNDSDCFRGILAAAGQFSFASATVDGASVAGGAGDLVGNGFGGALSPALARIQQSGGLTAPVALVAGSMDNGSTSSLSDPRSVATFIRTACSATPLASSLTAAGWPGVLGQASDAFVPRTSQLAGRNGQEFSGLVHSEGMEELGFNPPGELDPQNPVVAAVISLLNASVRSNSFQTLP